MEYLVAVLLPQLLHGVVFGAALGLLALGLTVIFGLLGVMNFAHGELYMFGAYAGIVVIGLTNSFWVALVAAPLLVAVLGAVTEVATLRPLYRRAPALRRGHAPDPPPHRGLDSAPGHDLSEVPAVPARGFLGPPPGHLALLHPDAGRHHRARRRAGRRDARRARRQRATRLHPD